MKKNDIILIEDGSRFRAKLPMLFICDNGDFDWSMEEGEVHEVGKIQRGLDTNIFKGKWIVTEIISYTNNSDNISTTDYIATCHKVVNKFPSGLSKLSDFYIKINTTQDKFNIVGEAKVKMEYVI